MRRMGMDEMYRKGENYKQALVESKRWQCVGRVKKHLGTRI